MPYEKPQPTKQEILDALADVARQLKTETNSLQKLALQSRQRVLNAKLKEFVKPKNRIQ
jgi:hypothetical protein